MSSIIFVSWPLVLIRDTSYTKPDRLHLPKAAASLLLRTSASSPRSRHDCSEPDSVLPLRFSSANSISSCRKMSQASIFLFGGVAFGALEQPPLSFLGVRSLLVVLLILASPSSYSYSSSVKSQAQLPQELPWAHTSRCSPCSQASPGNSGIPGLPLPLRAPEGLCREGEKFRLLECGWLEEQPVIRARLLRFEELDL